MSLVVLCSFALLASIAALVRAWKDHCFYRARVRELEKRVLDSERLLRVRSNLANEIAHEIKNPVSAILCSAETLDLLLGEDLAPEHRQSLRYISEYGSNLLRLVSDFLDVSVAESGHLRASPATIEAVPLVKSILGLLESNAKKKKISLNFYSLAEDLNCYMDPIHLKQILFNLVHNAIKFTPENGEIQVVVKSDFPNPYLIIEVKDNGNGIPDDEIDSLFNLYARYEENQPLFGEGLGLGLALCKSLVELAQGEILVKSTVGVGTTFKLAIPVPKLEKNDFQDSTKEQRKEAKENDCRPGEKPLIGQKFLVVDEDTGSRETVALLIEAWGGIVDKAAAGVEAIEALKSESYAAAVIDCKTDGGYGCELTRMIKEDLKPEDTAIIVTGESNENQVSALEAGADNYVEKPLSGKKLLDYLLRSGRLTLSH